MLGRESSSTFPSPPSRLRSLLDSDSLPTFFPSLFPAVYSFETTSLSRESVDSSRPATVMVSRIRARRKRVEPTTQTLIRPSSRSFLRQSYSKCVISLSQVVFLGGLPLPSRRRESTFPPFASFSFSTGPLPRQAPRGGPILLGHLRHRRPRIAYPQLLQEVVVPTERQSRHRTHDSISQRSSKHHALQRQDLERMGNP